MKLFLLVLSLYSIIQTCYSIGCQLLPPGLDRLSHGIDITSFDLFPTDPMQPNGIARDIFDFTCDQKKKWQSPFTNQAYDLPDQVKSIAILHDGILNNKVDIQVNFPDTKRVRAMELGLNDVKGYFTFSSTSKKHLEQMQAKGRIITTVSAHASAIQVELIPSALEHAGAYMKQFYDQFLPNNYLENPGKYQEFLSNFGTHFFQTSRFGGAIQVEIDTDRDFYFSNYQKGKNFGDLANTTFFNLLTVSGGFKSSKKQVDNTYNEKSITTALYFGGIAELVNTPNSGFDAWVSSAQKMPWLFGGQLTSILDFLPAGLKKNAVNTAITVKLDYAYLDELSHSLALLKLNPYIDMASANSYINQVVAVRGQVIPPHDRVAQLGAAIEAFVNVQKDKRAPVPVVTVPPKPVCKVTYDKKQKKNVCVNPTTCICKV